MSNDNTIGEWPDALGNEEDDNPQHTEKPSDLSRLVAALRAVADQELESHDREARLKLDDYQIRCYITRATERILNSLASELERGEK